MDRSYLEGNGVDVNAGLELLGDMDMYNETMGDFLEEINEKLPKLVEYKNNNDMPNYAIIVHSIKSDSKYLGFTKLAELAYNHEMKSKANDTSYVNANYDELQKEIKAAGEAVKQEAYEKAYDHVFQILDNLEKLLNDNRYLEGNEITEEDKRLYDILIRFDAVYYFKQRLNRKALRDYDNLWNYAKELYSIPEYKEFADFEKIKQEELLGTKEENPYQIVGLGPDESYWNEPNNRAEKFA